MPLKMTAQDRASLIVAVSNAVRTANCNPYGTYAEFDPNLEISEGLMRALEKHLDRGGIQQFIGDRLHRIAVAKGLQDEGVDFVKIPGCADPAQFAEKLVDELQSLPWQYRIIVRGPKYIHAGTKKTSFSVTLSDKLSLVSSNILSKELSFHSGNDVLDKWLWEDWLLPERRAFAPNHMYFVYRYTGFVPHEYFTKAADELEEEVRAFYGAAITFGLILPYGYPDEWHESFSILGVVSGGGLEGVGSLAGPGSLASYYYSARELRRQFRTSEALQKVLEPIVGLFAASSAQRLKTAASWILRASSSTKPMDRVLESAIASEVLLGDRKMSDKIGLTRLMSNRCAYALGKSEGERKNIVDFFENFYKVRSDIVHTGRLYISMTESELVNRGLELAIRMLKHEYGLAITS